MSLIPWRIKAQLAYHFPLVYSYAINLGSHPYNVIREGEGIGAHWDLPNPIWPAVHSLLLELSNSTDAVLDVGVGTATMLRFLRENGYSDLHAVDATRYTLRRLWELGIDAREGLLPDIPYEDNRFDLVIASQILEHIPRRDKFLSNIRRVLKPDGRAMIFVPDRCLTPLDEPSHVAVYDRYKLARVVRKHFTVERLESMKDTNHDTPILFALLKKGI